MYTSHAESFNITVIPKDTRLKNTQGWEENYSDTSIETDKGRRQKEPEELKEAESKEVIVVSGRS